MINFLPLLWLPGVFKDQSCKILCEQVAVLQEASWSRVSWFVETIPGRGLPQNIWIVPEMLLGNVPGQIGSILTHFPWFHMTSTPL